MFEFFSVRMFSDMSDEELLQGVEELEQVAAEEEVAAERPESPDPFEFPIRVPRAPPPSRRASPEVYVAALDPLFNSVSVFRGLRIQ